MVSRDLTLTEFIGPLSLCMYVDQEANEEFKAFTDVITGDKARRDRERKELEGDKDEGKKDAKGGKKKGKK